MAVDDDGGYFRVLCTGSPTDHDCDRSGRLDAGPAGVDYRGFNDDSLAGGYSRFGDDVVVTVGDRQYTVAFTREFTDEPPEESPCRPDGDGEDPEGGHDDGSDDESDDDGGDGTTMTAARTATMAARTERTARAGAEPARRLGARNPRRV